MNPSPLVGGLPARESMRVNEFNPNFLAAEMGAFPFTSKCALEMALTCVNPWMDRDTVRLWRSAEEQILVNRPTISLDEAVLIRDYTWFAPALRSNQFDPIRLDQLLCHMASRLLGIEGQDAVPHSPSSASHSMDTAAGRNLWMWIQLAVPEDLLVAALEVVHKCGPLRVRNVSPSLAGMLRREGFAEIHVHAGAAMEFELIWVASLVLISLDATKSDVFKSPGAELNQGRAMAWWLAAASVGRVLIAEFLALPPKPERRFATFVTERLQAFERSVARTVAVVLDQFINIDRLPASATRDFTQARNAVRALLPQKQCSKPQVESLNEDDPIASLLGQPLPASVTPDRFLIRNGLEHCCSGQDSVFASVYWQVIRVRCIYYRHLVMRPTSRGLQQFMRHFGRLNPGKQKLGGRAKLSSALAVAGRDHGLTAVELRATPEDSKTKMDGVFKYTRSWLRT